ncbi:MAG: hypothetical protein K0S49_1770 [Microbacterium sp.]|nr:hypothetical protein [Microbacterium sp.]
MLRRPAEREDRSWWNDSTKSSRRHARTTGPHRGPIAIGPHDYPSTPDDNARPPICQDSSNEIPMFHVKHPAAATTSATRRPGADASRRALETRPSPQSSSGFAIASAATTPARQHASVLIGRTVSGSPRSRPRCAQAAAGFSATITLPGQPPLPTMAPPVIRTTYWSRSAGRHPHRFPPSSEASPTGTTPTIGTTRGEGGASRETSQDQHPAKRSSVHTASLPPPRRPGPPVSARMGGVGDSCRAFVAAARRTAWPVRTFTRRVADPCHIAADR